MNYQLGRNDRCSCGSGKKYKHCCAKNASPSSKFSVGDLEWQQLRQLEGIIFEKHLLPYLQESLPAEVMYSGIADCLRDDLLEIVDEKIIFDQFLMHWVLFNWIPDEDFGVENFDPEITIAENFLNNNKEKLDSNERRFIEVMLTTFYSFYAILEVEIDQSLLVKDLLLGTEHLIKERKATHYVKRGDIIFSRILTVDNQSIFIGMAPYILPPNYHTLLLNFKKYLIKENDGNPLDKNVLRNELDLELCDYFFDAIIDIHNAPPPVLVNTDGELIQLTTSYFELATSIEETLQRLMSMTLCDDPEDFLQDAKRSKRGEITEVRIPWLKKGNKKHKHWDNTVYGDVIIKKGKLILETNSAGRGEKGKKLLKKLLGNAIRFQKTVIESPEEKMKPLAKAKKVEANKTMPKLEDTPEMQEKIKEVIKAHWDSWFDIPLPILGNKTPRQAAKTEEGCEQLEALFLEFEGMNHGKDKNDPLRTDIDFLKKTLGLKK